MKERSGVQAEAGRDVGHPSAATLVDLACGRVHERALLRRLVAHCGGCRECALQVRAVALLRRAFTFNAEPRAQGAEEGELDSAAVVPGRS